MANPSKVAPTPTYTIPIYGGKIQLVTKRATWKRIAKEWEDWEPERLHPGVSGLTATISDRDGKPYYVVAVFDRRETTLLHELTHVALSVFEMHCIDPCGSNGEPFAYFLEAIYRECRELLRGEF